MFEPVAPPAEDVVTITLTEDDRLRLGVLLLDARARLPAYQTAHASGLDLHALDEVSPETRERQRLPRTIHTGDSILLGTGVAVAIPDGHEGQVRGRSSLAAKHNVLATLGTIDADYRGEVLVQLVNLGPSFTVHEGDRVAQLVIAPVTRCRVVQVDGLPSTERGAGGLGSTGR